MSQLAGAVFGQGSAMYFVVQIMTVVILALAANTAYAGMPLLMALMAEDGFLPRQLVARGTRLNYSNGILLLFISFPHPSWSSPLTATSIFCSRFTPAACLSPSCSASTACLSTG